MPTPTPPRAQPPAGPVTASTSPHRSPPVRQVSAEQLFDGAHEVVIVHGGSSYRLRQTSLGKLILTK